MHARLQEPHEGDLHAIAMTSATTDAVKCHEMRSTSPCHVGHCIESVMRAVNLICGVQYD